jgi:RNA polymerase sigma-70 factor (ECF subfamily)
MKKLTDEELVSSVQEGDKEAFGEIIERYESQLKAYAFRLTGNHEIVEDIVQEAFLKSYRDIQSFDVKKKFSSWIYRIVHNQSIDMARKHSRTTNLEEFEEIPDTRNLAQEIHEKLDSKEDERKLSEAISQLPPKYRDPIILKYYENKEYEEISDILKFPTGTVGTLISRGKERIRKAIEALA